MSGQMNWSAEWENPGALAEWRIKIEQSNGSEASKTLAEWEDQKGSTKWEGQNGTAEWEDQNGTAD